MVQKVAQACTRVAAAPSPATAAMAVVSIVLKVARACPMVPTVVRQHPRLVALEALAVATAAVR